MWIFCGALAAPSAARAVGDFQAEPSSGPRAMGTPSLLKSSSSSHRTERIKALDRAICYWLSETVSPLRHNFNGICTSRGGAGQSSLFSAGASIPGFYFLLRSPKASQPLPDCLCKYCSTILCRNWTAVQFETFSQTRMHKVLSRESGHVIHSCTSRSVSLADTIPGTESHL